MIPKRHDEVDVFRLAGGSVDGRYVIERAVAEGGFGVVYRGHQVALERPVAVKVLKTPSDLGPAAREEFLEGFAQEARTIARIAHPNIVQVYDFGVSTMPSGERAAWMALEWLTGVTLEAELEPRRGLGGRTPAECMALLRPIVDALSVVHAAGVAHRDLKPANIMQVNNAQGTGVVPKLLDFGIAKAMGQDEVAGGAHTATRSRQVAFSPYYAAPEQVSHARSGPWTDVHALGLVLTELLTDTPPFSGATSTALFQQILDASSRPTPGRFNVDVGAWEPVLARATAVTPSDRYRTAGELLAALEEALPGATHARRGPVPSPAGFDPTTAATSVEPPTRETAFVATAQSGQRPSAPPKRGESSFTTARTPRGASIAAVASASVLLVAAILAVASRSAPTKAPDKPITEGADRTAGAPSPSPPPPPAESPRAASTPSASATSAPLTPPSSASSPRREAPAKAVAPASRPTTARPASAPSKAVNCDPPFSVDANGAKHYKPECDN